MVNRNKNCQTTVHNNHSHRSLPAESFGRQESLDTWVERTLQHAVPSFIWAFRSRIKWKSLFPHQIVSVHPKAFFTTKVKPVEIAYDQLININMSQFNPSGWPFAMLE